MSSTNTNQKILVLAALLALLIFDAMSTAHAQKGGDHYGEMMSQILSGRQTNPDAATTADLVVPDGFAFDGSWTLSLDIDVADLVSEPAHLLVCREYRETDGLYEVDYDSCQLSTPLTDGKYLGELTMVDTVDRLIAVVLPLSDPNSAHYFEWFSEDGKRSLVI